MKKMFWVFVGLLPLMVNAGGRMVVTEVSCSGDCVETYYSFEVYAEPSELGMPGGFFIGAVKGQQLLYLGKTSGWQQYTGGMGEAIELFESMPSTAYRFHPISGAVLSGPVQTVVPGQRPVFGSNVGYGAKKEDICSAAGDGTIEFYVGTGVLTPDKEELVKTYHSINNPRIPANHIRNVYLQNNMGEFKKVWEIGSFNCSRDSN